MLACDIVHEQLVAVHQELGALAVESSMVLAKQTRQANTNTINIVSALVIGVLLQTAGQVDSTVSLERLSQLIASQ